MNDNSRIIVENNQQLQQLIREAEEQRCHRYSLELERQLGRIGIEPPSEHEQNIRQLWSEISRVRRNDPTLSNWQCNLPQFHEPSLFRSWRQALQQSQHLDTLELSSKWILLDEVATAVADGMKQTTVQTLVLKSSIREDPFLNNWSIVYQGLQFLQTIQQLTLTRVPIGNGCSEPLLLPNSLKELTLKRVTLTQSGAIALAKAIGQSKLESLNVRLASIEEISLRLSQNRTPQVEASFHAKLLGEALLETSTLSKLELYGGKWDEFGMATTLARGMNDNLSLKSLSFERCVLKDDGAALLFYLGLKRNVTLTHLTLNECGVGDVGIGWMTENWPATSTIQSLTLTNNTIGPRGVRLLLEALRGLPSMQKLDLGDNSDIGYQGLQIIGEDLTNQPYLTHLSLMNCVTWTEYQDPERVEAQEIAQQQAGQALLEGIKRNQQIKSLKLFGISFPWHEAHEIDYYVGLNICGRHLLSTHDELATGVWSHILAKCQRQDHQQANLTYFFLQERPDLVQMFGTPGSVQTTRRPTHEEHPRKRQRKSK